MKRLLSIVLAFVLAFGLTTVPISVQPALANPGTIYVSISGDDTTGDGSAGSPYRTIQKGIDEAALISENVTVLAGTYAENIVLKSGVSVTGAGASVTTIDGGGIGSVITGPDVLPDVTIKGFTITGGAATRGGGIYLENEAITIISCIITGNSAAIGGGIYMSSSLTSMSPKIINSLITNNNASQWGGGIFFFGAMLSPTIMNSTIADNTAGDGVYNWFVSTTITNTIIYGNSGVDVTNSGGTLITSNNIVGTGATGTGTDPLFVGSGDYHLQSGSPGIDAGTGTGAPSDDLDGIPRPQGDNVDIGAYEYPLVANYTLTINAVGDGGVSADPVGLTYPSGTVVTLTAQPADGWSFAEWGGDLSGSTDIQETITMDSDKNVTAVFTVATTPMEKFNVTHAKIDFKKKPDDGKIRVKGKLELDLDNGDGVAISENVTVTVGPLSEIILMSEKGKKGEKWEYKRPKHGEGNIKHMTINWKNGKFDIRMDKADLSGVTNPVTISLQIGDDLGEETVQMREKKHHWDYKYHDKDDDDDDG